MSSVVQACAGKAPERWQAGRLSSDGNAASVPRWAALAPPGTERPVPSGGRARASHGCRRPALAFRSMAKSNTRSPRTSYRCAECGWATASGSAAAPSARRGARSPRPARRRHRAHGRAARSRAPARADRPGRRPEAARPAPASASSTGCSAAAWCPARWCCSPASPASASRRCCSTSPSSGRARRAAASLVSAARSRPARCGCAPSASAPCTTQLYLAAETDLGAVLGHLDAVKPGLLVLDSVQTIAAPGTEGVPGGVTQVRAVTAALVARRQGARHRHRAGRPRHQGRQRRRPARAGAPGRRGAALRGRQALLAAPGPRREEPVRRRRRGRLLRDARGRHRRGWPTRPGCSSRTHAEPVPGTCVTVAMEGRRPLVTEVQALIGADRRPGARGAPSPASTAPGWRWCWPCCSSTAAIRLHDQEVFAATVGGIRLTEPAPTWRWRSRVASAASTWRSRRAWSRSARSA